MAFTFDPALPTTRDRVRLRLGDTEEKRRIFEDETIDYVLASVSSNEAQAAWRLCKYAVAQYSRDVDSEGAGLRAARAQKVAQLTELCGLLEREVLATARPVFTGASHDVTRELVEDDDFPGFGVRVGRGAYPGLRTK